MDRLRSRIPADFVLNEEIYRVASLLLWLCETDMDAEGMRRNGIDWWTSGYRFEGMDVSANISEVIIEIH